MTYIRPAPTTPTTQLFNWYRTAVGQVKWVGLPTALIIWVELYPTATIKAAPVQGLVALSQTKYIPLMLDFAVSVYSAVMLIPNPKVIDGGKALPVSTFGELEILKFQIAGLSVRFPAMEGGEYTIMQNSAVDPGSIKNTGALLIPLEIPLLLVHGYETIGPLK